MTAPERADDAPPLSISLHQGNMGGNGEFHLTRKSFSMLNFAEIASYETERTLKLVCNSLVDGGRYKRLDLEAAAKSGLLEIVESGKDDVLKLPSDEPRALDSVDIQPEDQKRIFIQAESTSETWQAVLKSGKMYELRLSRSGGEVWAYYNDYEPSKSQVAMPSDRRLPVGRDTTSTIRFTVYDFPAAPKLFAKLNVPDECHLSGTPPFTITIEFSTDSNQTITINKSRTPLSSFLYNFHGLENLIECVDTETGKVVDWSEQFFCFDSDPHPEFPDDDDFVEVGPSQVWLYEYTISESSAGALNELTAGRSYRAQVATKYIGGFERWMFGKREDLLKGDLEEKKQRWKIDGVKTGAVIVNLREEPVVFKVVE